MAKRSTAFDRPVFRIAPVVEALATESTTITYRNGWSAMRCAFHPDRSPSATINHTAQRYHCFTCGIQYEDAIGLIQYVQGCDYASAVEEATRIAGTGDGEVRGKSGRPSLKLFV